MSESIMVAAAILRPTPSLFLAGLIPTTTPRRRRTTKKSPLFCSAQLPLADLAPPTAAAYGALLLGGGVFAYSRSGSKGSLAGGVSGAVLMGTVYYLMQAPETRHAADALGFGTAFIFSAVFGIRLAATQKFVPSGALLGLSILSLIVFVSAYLQKGV